MNKHKRAALVRRQYDANQLKTLYGDNIPAAMASSEAAALRMNNVLSTINTTIRTGATTFASDFVNSLVKGETVLQALQASASALGKTLIDAGLKTLVTDGLNALSGPATGAASSLASSAGLTAGATTAAATLTAAGSAAGAALASGAADAASILGIGGTTAGTNVGAGSTTAATVLGASGTTTGAEVATGGELAGTGLATGGAAAGLALWGPIAALGAVAAGVALSLFADESKNRKTNDGTQHRSPTAAQTDFSVVGRGELPADRRNGRDGVEGLPGPVVAGDRGRPWPVASARFARPASRVGLPDLGLDGSTRRGRPARHGRRLRRLDADRNNRIGTGGLVARARAA
jgi:hypothetical protein